MPRWLRSPQLKQQFQTDPQHPLGLVQVNRQGNLVRPYREKDSSGFVFKE